MDIKKIAFGVCVIIGCSIIVGMCRMQTVIKKPNDLATLFAISAADITTKTDICIADAQQRLDAIKKISTVERTFENTARALDRICHESECALFSNLVQVLELISPNADVRAAAHTAVAKINDFLVDQITNNVEIYTALREYAENNAAAENLSQEQCYFIDKTLADYKRAGVHLPEGERRRVAQLKKELAKLAQDFETNIATDSSTIIVPKEALSGLSEDFVATLKKTESGEYILGVDYPTYHNVMENCAVERTRQQLNRIFNNRAYPANEKILQEVITKRHELARLLGYSSFAQLDLDDQMVGTPAHAAQFLRELFEKASLKEAQEYAQLTAELPDGVSLTDNGTIKSWDLAYIKSQYKKKQLALDERLVAEYFPMQKTIEGLLAIYRDFLGLEFRQVPVSGLWTDDIQVVEVMQNNAILGYIILDLHPRANKFSHACHCTLVPSLAAQTSPAVGIVIANFPQGTTDKPALLQRSDVKTFFHEFGHALHAVLGRTQLGAFAGTNTKLDFVELPSQILEEWLWDRTILKELSSHYVTGQQLPDYLLDAIAATKNLDTGTFVQTQILYARLSLEYFNQIASAEVDAILKQLATRLRPHVAFDDSNHFYAAFGHLMGYGAKYYGYLWSKVFALDVFAQIKKGGLRNPVVGARYVQEILMPGGSKDPQELLRAFLGREPNQEAFIADLGLTETKPDVSGVVSTSFIPNA